MQYFGVPTCPYCKKRVNLIRTWSLKRQGEYQCPRCGGISNIYLSPLIYVLGLLAVFTSGVLYFFHKFVLDDISLETALYVFLPFAAFFLFSLFMVYLEKPVIKRISRAEYEKRRLFRGGKEEPSPAPAQRPEYFAEEEDHFPRASQRTGPVPQPGKSDTGVVNQQAFQRARVQAEKDNLQMSQRIHVPRPAQPKPQPPQPPRPARPVAQPAPSQRPAASVANNRPTGYGQPARQGMSFAQQGASMQHGGRPASGAPRAGMGTPVSQVGGPRPGGPAAAQRRPGQQEQNTPNGRQFR